VSCKLSSSSNGNIELVEIILIANNNVDRLCEVLQSHERSCEGHTDQRCCMHAEICIVIICYNY